MSREFFEIGFWTAVIVAAIIATLHESGYSLMNAMSASLPTGLRDMQSELAYALMGVSFVSGLVLGFCIFAYVSFRRRRRQRQDEQLPLLPSPFLVPPKGSQVEHAQQDLPLEPRGHDGKIQNGAQVNLRSSP